MANITVRLTKRVKIADAYSKNLLNEFSAKLSPEDFRSFLSSMTKMPWRYCPVVVVGKGRHDFGRVKLPGISVKIPSTKGKPTGIKNVDGPEVDIPRKIGSYHLDYRENGVRHWPTVIKVLIDAGRNWVTADNLSPRDITDAIGIVERRLNAIRHGDIQPVQRKPKKQKGCRVPLRDHIASWLLERTPDPGRISTEEALTKSTLSSYGYALEMFADYCISRKRECVEDIAREDLKFFYGYMATVPNKRSETGFGLSNNSRNTKITMVCTFLRTVGRGGILETWDGVRNVPTVKRARSEDTDIRDYSNQELEQFFRVMDEEEADLFTFFLATGERAEEVAVAEWHELDAELGIVKVRKKWVTLGDGRRIYWVPKYRKERDIPAPQALFDRMKARQKRLAPSNLIFPVSVTYPKGVFLRMMKAIGRRAGLACGHCLGCRNFACTHRGGCDDHYLHRWRHTFACRHLRGNPDRTGKFDLKTVSEWLGHRTTKITERYLYAAVGPEVQQKLNEGPLGRPYRVPAPPTGSLTPKSSEAA
ncbi:MAG: tyrosine-type recombinase/integrase [Terracidiphilus sp.]